MLRLVCAQEREQVVGLAGARAQVDVRHKNGAVTRLVCTMVIRFVFHRSHARKAVTSRSLGARSF